MNEEVLSHIEKVLDNKTVKEVLDIKEPDSEQGVLVDDEEIDEDNLYDEDYYLWEKESVEELHLQDISQDFEDDIVIDKNSQMEIIKTMMSLDEKDTLHIEEEWNNTLNDGLESLENEWDEDHALDMVMNDMVKDFTEEDIQKIVESNDNEDEPNEDLLIATEKFKELNEIIVNDSEEIVIDKSIVDGVIEVTPPEIKTNISPYLRVGNRVIPRNKRYGK